MARVFKNPKPYSDVLGQRFNHQVFVIIAILSGLAVAYWVSKVESLLFALFGYAVLGIFLKIFWDILKQVAKRDRGDDAEYEISRMLEELPNEYSIFQNVPIKKNLDIDLVLVGPFGVIAIEVKSHKYFSRFGKDFIGQASAEATGLKSHLKKSGIQVYIPALLVFTRAFIRFNLKPQRGVYVLGKNGLMEFLSHGKRVEFDQPKAEQAIQFLYTLF